MNVDACCHCGEITYEAEIDPEQVVICHCTDCQTFSSAPYRVSVFGVSAEQVHIKGSPKIYSKVGGSGKEVLVAFCSNCGTALFSKKPGNDSPLNLRVGAIRQRGELKPKMQGFCGSAMSWAMDIGHIHKIPEADRS